ncbi:hypothetical protein CTE05_25830 [Cellulomonas terrae]|uniref:Uncharacterized protein n=1 Tax=Cellulomonas terrae TaxID=311234 RepID=A0A511JM41_9CELL|nr:hypothetical protein CTE05_25830 [Cellulomonas terrae]
MGSFVVSAAPFSLLLALREGLYRDRPPGQRLGGTTDEAELRNYRLGFDEYGTLDVICSRLRVERLRARSFRDA